MILVVGATGQLGSLVVHALRDGGRPVRAMVRDPAAARDLAATGSELATEDLTRPETLDAALDGVTAVVATANVAAPTRAGDTAAALDAGYREPVTRAQRAGVSRFALASVPETALDDRVPIAASKRPIERLLAASTLSWVSLRMPPGPSGSSACQRRPSPSPSGCSGGSRRPWPGSWGSTGSSPLPAAPGRRPTWSTGWASDRCARSRRCCARRRRCSRRARTRATRGRACRAPRR